MAAPDPESDDSRDAVAIQVKPIPQQADDLAAPQPPKVAIVAKQLAVGDGLGGCRHWRTVTPMVGLVNAEVR